MKNKMISAGKRILSLILTLTLVMGTVCFFTIPASAADYKSSGTTIGDTTFIVPEAIYLAPNGSSWTETTATPFQYYINNDCSTGATKSGKDTTGYLRFTYSGNTTLKPTITYSFLDTSFDALSGGSVSLSTTTPTSGTTFNLNSGSSPSLGASTNGCYIQWVASFTDPVDGKAKKVTAYTYVYKPYVVPVGGFVRVENTRWGNSFAQSITWLSGVHSITVGGLHDDGGYYPRYSGGSGFSAFITSGSMAYYGSTSQNSITPAKSSMLSASWNNKSYAMTGADCWNLAFMNGSTSSGPYMRTSANGNGATDWGSTSTSGCFNVRSMDYWWKETSAQNLLVNLTSGASGNITIDTSRYSDLSQIPNLAGGLMATDADACDGGSNWMVADASGITNGRNCDYWTGADTCKAYQGYKNYAIARKGADGRTDCADGDSPEGVKYAGPWPRTLLGSTSTQGGTYIYSFMGWFTTNDSGDYSFNRCTVDLNATYYNKANLRTAITNARKAMAKLGVNAVSNGTLTSCYFDANSNYAWTTFQTAYKNAEKALGKVDGTIDNPDTLATNLNNALNALCTKVTFNANGGTLSGTTPQYVTIGTNQKVSVTPSNLGVSATRSGWTLAGWSTSSSSTSPASSVSVGYNDTLYAIWKKTATVTFYSGINKATSSTVTATFWNGASSTTITTPTSYAAVWTFNGWTTSTSASSSASTAAAGASVSVTGAATYYALYTQSHKLTYNANGGSGTVPSASTATGYYNSYGSQSNGSRALATNNLTKTGYTANGWNTKADGTGTHYNNGATYTNSSASDNVYAQWKINTYTITFKGADGTVLNTQTVDHGATPTAPSIPAKLPDPTNHYTGAWDKTIAAATANTTYTVVYTGTAHSGGTATCTEKAKCSTCGTSYGAFGAHNPQKISSVAATCLAAGNNEYYKCARCNKYFTSSACTTETTVAAQTIAQKSHSYSGEVRSNGGGTHSYKCVNGCGNYGGTVDCSFGEYTVTTPAGCVTAGSKQRTCSVCGYVQITPIAATGHAPEKIAAAAATCTTAGNNEYYKCNNCNKYYTTFACTTETTVAAQTIAALGHSSQKIAAVAATCTTAGNNEYYKCTRCNKYFTTSACTTETTVSAQTISALGHSTQKIAAVAATCLTAGNNEYYKCTRCNKYFTTSDCIAETTVSAQTVAQKAHSYTGTIRNNNNGTHSFKCVNGCDQYGGTVDCTYDSSVKVPAACTEKGTTTYTCKHCSYSYDAQDINALGHNMTKTEAKAATCLAAGNNAYYTCSRCNKVFTDEAGNTETTAAGQMIPQKEHSYTGAIKCNNDGTHSYKCVNGCNNYGAAEDCNFGEWTQITAPTINAEGEEQHVCSECGCIETRVIEKLPIIIDCYENGTTDITESIDELEISGTVRLPVPENLIPDKREFLYWTTEADGSGTGYDTETDYSVSEFINGDTVKSVYAQWATKTEYTYDFDFAVNKDYSDTAPASIDHKTVNGDIINKLDVNRQGDILGSGSTKAVYTKENGAWNVVKAIPASNVYYEETALNYTPGTDKPAWSVSTGAKKAIALEDDRVFGFTSAYNASTADAFSNGTAANVAVSTDNAASKPADFTFTGTGFDFVSACGKDTGSFVIKVAQNGKTVKTYIIDTYLDDPADGTPVCKAADGLLHQTPICRFNGAWGTYDVTATAVMLTSSGGYKNANGTADGSFEAAVGRRDVKESVIEQLDAMGIIIDDPDGLELVFFDDNSVLNGGTGNAFVSAAADNGSAAQNGASSTDKKNVTLNCYIDGVRIYDPLNGNGYTEEENGFTYLNIVNDLAGEDNTLGYYELAGDNLVDKKYNNLYPVNEIYLIGTDNQNSLAFTVNNVETNAEIYLGLRAVKGTPTVRFTSGSSTEGDVDDIVVLSATEMYYKIPKCYIDYAKDGSSATVVVQVLENDGSILAVNNLKYKAVDVSKQADEEPSSPASNGTLKTVRFLMSLAPRKAPEEEETVITDDETTTIISEEETTVIPEESGSDEEPAEEASTGWFDFVIELIRKLIAFIRKLFTR